MNRTFSTLSASILLFSVLGAPLTGAANTEETVDSLKKQLAGMEKQFAAVTKDRDGLYEQLLSTIEEIEALQGADNAEAAQLQTKLDQVTAGREHLSARLLEKMAEADEEKQMLQDELDSTLSSSEYLANRLESMRAQSKDSAAEHDAALAKLQGDTAKADEEKQVLQDELASTVSGSEYLANRLESMQAQSKASSADHEAAVAKLEADSNSVAEVALVQIKSALGERNAAREALEASQKTNARQASDIESIINGRSYIEKKLAEANAKAAEQATSLAAVQAELSTFKAAATAAAAEIENKNNWGTNVAQALQERLSGMDGIEVAELGDNRVNVRIGTAGLFRSGGKELSDDGRSMVDLVGYALLNHPEAKILVTGHTDSVPVGNSSRYSDNDDLSNQRALEAMNQLGSLGLPFSQMTSAGMGSNAPLASNDTAEGRRLNRRVELTISQ